MPINKVFSSFAEAVSDIPNGATILLDGFAGPGGMASNLIKALRDHGAKNLTIVSNAAGLSGFGSKWGRPFIDSAIFFENHQVKKVIASFPVPRSPSQYSAFYQAFRSGEVELEVVPQGTLAERIRAGGAGIAAFYTPTGAGTVIAQGKESRVFDGREYVLEKAIKADFTLMWAYRADTFGNLVYKGSSRNFNAVMAPAGKTTIVEVDQIVELGSIDPECIVTPGLYVDRLVQRPPEDK